MRIDEVRIFATGYSVDNMLNEIINDPIKLGKAFKTRVDEFYLNPALNSSAFAQGVLIFALIDYLANIVINDHRQVQEYKDFLHSFAEKSVPPKRLSVEDRIITFLVKEIKTLDYEYGYYFYKYVRNGLIHEGRIKCGCYIDNRIGKVYEDENGILVFNPNVILQQLHKWLKKYLQKIESGKESYNNLKRYIVKTLNGDSKAIKKRSKKNKLPC